MTTAAPIASRGTSAHLPAGLVVLHPAAPPLSALRSVLVCLRLRSLFALLVRLMRPVLRRWLSPPTLPPFLFRHLHRFALPLLMRRLLA